ncbi:hypothetical protein RRG08_058512 [Elysia crispata]|uniref:Uncharacterized protein n=1 Tax=Elysia crispata TaxID=231223 RepID=A0AAE1DNE9_9GAST|nr:hypothetical protein RRG08_058512 [Elysia crispata]
MAVASEGRSDIKRVLFARIQSESSGDSSPPDRLPLSTHYCSLLPHCQRLHGTQTDRSPNKFFSACW